MEESCSVISDATQETVSCTDTASKLLCPSSTMITCSEKIAMLQKRWWDPNHRQNTRPAENRHLRKSYQLDFKTQSMECGIFIAETVTLSSRQCSTANYDAKHLRPLLSEAKTIPLLSGGTDLPSGQLNYASDSESQLFLTAHIFIFSSPLFFLASGCTTPTDAIAWWDYNVQEDKRSAENTLRAWVEEAGELPRAVGNHLLPQTSNIW